jgi:hydroxyacylglutathione hydrolase
MIDVFRFVTGPIETNTWLVCNERHECIVVDPAFGCDEIIGKIKKDGLDCKAIALTHAHFDHISGIPELQESFGPLPVYIHPIEAPFLVNSQLNGSLWFGDEFIYPGPTEPLEEGFRTIGDFSFEVRHVPGHTPGGCALIIETFCLCGDSLFAGSIGRSDLPGGDGPGLINAIKAKLLTLPDATTVCPGHYGRTTVGREKKSNPYLL